MHLLYKPGRNVSIVQNLTRMYLVCVIVGRKDTASKDRVSGGHMTLPRGKTAVFHVWLCCIALHLQQKRAAVNNTVIQRTVTNGLLQGQLRVLLPVAYIPVA
ncbi:hypothetical protein TNCV_4958911 [Trichonephila clavipes]|uniref:Uncharacterized protein n=1 Tax=Trichonephila clavipes TaxID=2585209 RepID=A0A8X6SSB4_TRICX|nr:hypothetical protein TNCV_4958911 [Trichonephila clavipes]